MTTTIRSIDNGGSERFHRITHERSEGHGHTIWCLIGLTKMPRDTELGDAPGILEERTEICTFDKEEECLLALLALQQGGCWKRRGNTLTGD